MICPYCGKENNDNARFCLFCGKALAVPDEIFQQRPQQSVPGIKKWIPVAGICAAAVILFAGIFVIVRSYGGNQASHLSSVQVKQLPFTPEDILTIGGKDEINTTDAAETADTAVTDQSEQAAETEQAAESGTETEQVSEPTPAEAIPQEQDGRAGAAGDILPDSSSVYLTEEDLAPLSKEQLQTAINEIYARNGRTFRNPDIQAYFDAKSWYQGTIAPDVFDANQGAYFNQYELANVKLMENYRNTKNW